MYALPHGRLAQLVEQLIYTEKVTGSSPVSPTKRWLYSTNPSQISMHISRTKAPLALLIGDIVVLYSALWLTLLTRYQEIPSRELIDTHIVPFSILFMVWIVIFFVTGLYETDSSIPRARMPSVVFSTTTLNIIFAAILFYSIPYFGISPKTNLLIYLIYSSLLLSFWRLYLFPLVAGVEKKRAYIIGSGEELRELHTELSSPHSLHRLKSIAAYDISLEQNTEHLEQIIKRIISDDPGAVIIIDSKNPDILPSSAKLYNLIFSRVRFVEFQRVYEDVFEKVALSSIGHRWFIENISNSQRFIHDLLKRTLDIFVALIINILLLFIYPLVWLAIKIEDGGPLFITQERVGKDGKIFIIHKFRTMTGSENGVWLGETKLRITKIGAFLRKTSIDELPQCWNILKGDISLIGPRPDITGLEARLSQEIPYYKTRCLVTPGLSGWAQVRQRNIPQSIEQNKERLAYDLYYIKNRSITLDLTIMIRTARALVRRAFN